MHRTCILLLLASITFGHGEEPAKDKIPAPAPIPAAAPVELDAIARLTRKMDAIIIPAVHFENTTLEQALEFLRQKSRELDKSSDPSGDKGVNIILRQPALRDAPRITLDLKNVPLSEALRYVTELTRMVYRVEAQGVVLADMHASLSERHTRTFKVPPGFLSVGGSETPDAPADPFASSAPEPKPLVGKLQRKSVQQILEAAGIAFPEGSSASFNPLTGLLKVTNTLPNLDLVEAYCESITYCPAKNLAFNLTVIEAPGDLLRQLHAEASNSRDAGKLLVNLLDLAQKNAPSVRTVGAAFLASKSGTRATADALCVPCATSRAIKAAPSDTSNASEMPPRGLRLALEPLIQADGQTIELRFDLELSPPVSEKPHAGTNDSENTNPGGLPATDVATAHFVSTLLTHNGETRLVGMTRPPYLQQKTDDILWAAFVTSAIQEGEGLPHSLARGQPSTAKSPKDMSGITFQIPAKLFESIMEPSMSPLKDWLIEQGVTFPPDSRLDHQNDLLHVTNTEENIGAISTLISAAVQNSPKTVAVTLHTVRVPVSLWHDLPAAAMAKSDLSEQWKKLEEAAAREEVTFLASTFFECRSGTRSRHETGRECHVIAQVEDKDKSSPSISLRKEIRGSSLEFESVIRADGSLMDIIYAHEVRVPLGAPNDLPHHDIVESQPPSPATSGRSLKTVSTTTMHDGDIRLISLHQDISTQDAGHAWATFLRCHIVPQFPHPRRAVVTRFSPVAEKDSLETIAYHVPPDFIARIMSLDTPSMQESADPFAARSSTPRRTHQRNNHPLEHLGFTFPEGSSESFNPKISTLVVRNTPANHALLVAALDKIARAQPSNLIFTTHLLQGPGPLLRRLAAEASRKSDHRAELDELLLAVKAGTALHLDTAHIETKAGARATTRQGVQHTAICEISTTGKDAPVMKRGQRNVGLSLELEATQLEDGKDGTTVELTLSSEYHTAPPFEHREHIIDTQGRRLEFPLTDYFSSKLTTGITIPSGTARLLSLYKPTGKPEFEKEDILQAIFITCDLLHAGE